MRCEQCSHSYKVFFFKIGFFKSFKHFFKSRCIIGYPKYRNRDIKLVNQYSETSANGHSKQRTPAKNGQLFQVRIVCN